MPQSLLAFLAMMVAGIASINQFSRQIGTFEQTLLSEHLLMANASVIEQMEIIAASEDFDDLPAWDSTQVDLPFVAGDLTVEFDLLVTVQWTDEDGNPQAGPTNTQEVTIEGRHARYNRTLVTHSRLFSD